MRKIDETLANLRHLTSAKTDKDLSEILGFSYSSLDRWKAEDNIPAKRLMEFSKKLGVSMDTILGNSVKVVGDGNITFGGDNNQAKADKVEIYSFESWVEWNEFKTLFDLYGSKAQLLKFIKILKEISMEYW